MQTRYGSSRKTAEGAELKVALAIDGERFSLAIRCVGPDIPGGAPGRETWTFAGTWSRSGAQIVFQPLEGEYESWSELAFTSEEVCMMDTPFRRDWRSCRPFQAQTIPEIDGKDLPSRLRLAVPSEVAEIALFRYEDEVLTRE